MSRARDVAFIAFSVLFGGLWLFAAGMKIAGPVAAYEFLAHALPAGGVAKSAFYPSVFIAPSIGVDSRALSTLFDAPSLLWSLGVAATQTLFDAGKTDATVKIAQAGYSGAVANYRQSVLVAMQEVEDGMSGITLLGSAGKQADAAVRSSQRALELANDRYAGGVATYLEVITAQQTLLSNQRTAVGIHGQQMVTSVFLVKALGGGWQPEEPALADKPR